jgi:hypothetical protein
VATPHLPHAREANKSRQHALPGYTPIPERFAFHPAAGLGSRRASPMAPCPDSEMLPWTPPIQFGLSWRTPPGAPRNHERPSCLRHQVHPSCSGKGGFRRGLEGSDCRRRTHSKVRRFGPAGPGGGHRRRGATMTTMGECADEPLEAPSPGGLHTRPFLLRRDLSDKSSLRPGQRLAIQADPVCW